MAPKSSNMAQTSNVCHCGHVPLIAQQIAELKKLPLAEVYKTIRYLLMICIYIVLYIYHTISISQFSQLFLSYVMFYINLL